MSWLGGGRWRRREVSLSEQLGRYLERWQRRLADWLNARCSGICPAKLRFWLVVIAVSFAIYLLWVIVDAFK